MITENSLCLELMHRGYHPTTQDVIKNGVTLRVLTIRTDDEAIAPCIYIDRILEESDSPREAAEHIISIYESHRSINLGCDVQDLTDPDFIMANAYIGLQKTSEEDIIHRPSPYEGIEEFLYLRGESEDSSHWSVRIKPQMISEMDEADLWKTAEERTFRGFQISSLAEVLQNMGFPLECDVSDMTPPMYVISNPEKFRGAALACDLEALKKWAAEHDYSKAVILPSSVHEMLIIPIEGNEYDLDTFHNMVKEVNATQVDPTERLTDRAYLINLKGEAA